MNRRGLFKKHFCKKKNLNIYSETARTANFHFSHYKSIEIVSWHSNQSSFLIGTKTHLFLPPAYRCYMWNLVRIGFMASEEMSLENIDRWRMDGRRMPVYTISSPMSLWIRWAKNRTSRHTRKGTLALCSLGPLKRTRPAIQCGQIFRSFSEASSSSLYCVSEQPRLCQDCTDVQAHLSHCCLPMCLVPFSHETAQIVK